MSQTASAITRSPAEIVQNSPVSQAPNGICYARSGEITIADNDLDRIPQAANAPQQAAPQASANQVFFLQDDFIVTALLGARYLRSRTPDRRNCRRFLVVYYIANAGYLATMLA